MKNWQDDKKWSDRYLPAIKRALAPYVLREASLDDDQQRNTDLVVLRADSLRIGCRVRTPDYFEKYPFDVTVRCDRPSGNRSELAKIIAGWGDLFFYGHASPEDDGDLRAWCLVDLNEFRLWLVYEMWSGRKPPRAIPNADCSSSFIPFDIRKFSPGVLVANSGILSTLPDDEYERAERYAIQHEADDAAE
jgi:hypothetical protein